jgi:hypothetical protein
MRQADPPTRHAVRLAIQAPAYAGSRLLCCPAREARGAVTQARLTGCWRPSNGARGSRTRFPAASSKRSSPQRLALATLFSSARHTKRLCTGAALWARPLPAKAALEACARRRRASATARSERLPRAPGGNDSGWRAARGPREALAPRRVRYLGRQSTVAPQRRGQAAGTARRRRPRGGQVPERCESASWWRSVWGGAGNVRARVPPAQLTMARMGHGANAARICLCEIWSASAGAHTPTLAPQARSGARGGVRGQRLAPGAAPGPHRGGGPPGWVGHAIARMSAVDRPARLARAAAWPALLHNGRGGPIPGTSAAGTAPYTPGLGKQGTHARAPCGIKLHLQYMYTCFWNRKRGAFAQAIWQVA